MDSGIQRAIERIELEKARRELLYQRLREDPDYLLLWLEECSRDVVKWISDALWVPDEKGDYGGGCVPFVPYPKQVELLRFIDDLVSTHRRRDGMGLKSRQVGWTQIVLGWVDYAWRFRKGMSILLTSYEPEAVDMGGKYGRQPKHLFGKLRFMQDRLVEKLPMLQFNQDVVQRYAVDKTPSGLLKSEDSTNNLVRPKWVVHGQTLFDEARQNTINGDLPDDKTAKSRTYSIVFFDEIGEYKPGVDFGAWASAAPCCRHIFGFGTIPEDAREDCLLWKGTQSPEATMTPFHFHWSEVPVYMEDAYFVCKESSCLKEIEWPYATPGEKAIRVRCPVCSTTQVITQRDIRSPWFDDECAGACHNDPIKIGRYYQMDWGASAGDAIFYTFDRDQAVCHRDHVVGWIPMQGFDPGRNKRNPAAWMLTMFDPDTFRQRIVAWWMKHGVPIEWWYPFMAGISWDQLMKVKVISGPHVGKMWLEAHSYTPEERVMIERASCYPRGIVYGDRYGEASAGGAEAPYSVLRRYGLEIRTRGVPLKRGGKWGLIQKARDLYVPLLEIEPDVADYQPRDQGELYPSIVSCFAKARQGDTETGKGEPTGDFDKRTPRHVSHPLDAYCMIVLSLPNRIGGKVDPSGAVVPVRDSRYDEADTTYGEPLSAWGH